MLFLAQMTEETGQTEYAMAWALVAGLLFLGVLVIGVPRPRHHDIPENEKKKRLAGGGTTKKTKGSGKGSGRAGQAPSFGSLAQRNRK